MILQIIQQFAMIYFHYSISSTLGQISSLQEELKEGKSALSKVQTEKKELQGKLNDLEKVFSNL